MKMSHGLLLIICALSLKAFAWPKTASESLNARIESCLGRYGCSITGHAGVCRDSSEREGSGRSPTSCHLVCKAIDITSVRCTKSGTTSNHENLKLLRSCLSGLNYTSCYAGSGTCTANHMDHLHIGLREFFGCRG